MRRVAYVAFIAVLVVTILVLCVGIMSQVGTDLYELFSGTSCDPESSAYFVDAT